MTAETAPLVVGAGANVLVAGSAVFKGGPAAYAANIAAIRPRRRASAYAHAACHERNKIAKSSP